MTDDLHNDKKAIEVFETIADMTPAERQKWFEEQKELSEDIIKKVEQLFEAERQSTPLLHTGHAVFQIDEEEALPERVGAYRIVGLVGRGGMGAVYKAERDAGDFEHHVAVKLSRSAIKNERALLRFSEERQLLAKLNHPNISRLYDGGMLDDGRPYIVMELINGQPIPTFVAEHTFTEYQRLLLFFDVCKAIKFAHQNLIIHRDITPNNVLVDENNTVKIIDFGISKFSEVSSHKNDQSQARSGFTTGFAAPEQVEGGIDSTLSDIYSLGCLLRAIFEDTEIPDEVAAIANKASAESPPERYSSVDDMVEDLNAFLSDKPVLAYSFGTFYRTQKFFKRNVVSVAVGTIAIIAVLSALMATIVQYQEAQTNYEHSLARFNQVRELANYQIFELYDELSRVAGNTEIRASLASKSQGYLDNLIASDFADKALMLEAIAGYVKLARIFGVPAEPNLGDVKTSRESLSKAQTLLEQIIENNAPIKTDAINIADAKIKAARASILIHDDSKLDDAKEIIDEAFKQLESVAESSRDVEWYLAHKDLIYSALNHADQAGDTSSIRQLAKLNIDTIQKWPYELTLSIIDDTEQAAFYYWNGLADYLDGNAKGAVENFVKGHQAFAEVDNQQANNPMVLYLQAWNSYIGYAAAANLENAQLALQFLTDANEAASRLASVQENDASIIRLSMQLREAKSQLLASEGKFDEAIAMQKALIVDQQYQATSKPETSQFETWAFSKIILAFMYEDNQQRSLACKELDEAQKMLAPFVPNRQLSSYMYNAATRLADVVTACQQGRALGSQNALFE